MQWITTGDFIDKEPLEMLHKELCPVEIPESANKNYHCGFRGCFYATKEDNFKISITADDYYKLYINGRFVGQGVKQNYHFRYAYNIFDITDYIHVGENIIAVHVYYCGEINRSYTSGDNRFGLAADIFCGEKKIFGTNKSWRTSVLKEYVGTETVGYKTSYLENIDLRLEARGWRTENFDDTTWEYAIENPEDDHILQAVPTDALEVYEIKPAVIKKLDAGCFWLDFGMEITGQFYMRAQGKKGQQITVLCGEELREDGFVRYDMRCNCCYKELVTLSGYEDKILFYDYKAFRYVEIHSQLDNLNAKDFGAIVRHRHYKNIIALVRGSEELRAIWGICERGVMCGAQEVMVDCPSREKGQYLGDFLVSGLAHMYLTGDTFFYREILEDFAASCKICQGMMAVSPGYLMQEIADFSLLYPLMLLHYLKYSNDEKTVRNLLPVAEGILRHFEKFERTDGLLSSVSDKWNLVDWPHNLRDGYDCNLEMGSNDNGCHNVLNAHYIGAVTNVNTLRRMLGMKEDANKEKELKDAFVKTFYDEQRKLFKDRRESEHCSLHSNVLPAFFEIVPTEAKKTIREFIYKKGLCCGVWFSYFLLKALGRLGAEDYQYQLLTNDSIHGWRNMLREGATTCFEAWGKDQKHNTSLCHPWAATPIIILVEDLNGKFGIEIIEKNC